MGQQQMSLLDAKHVLGVNANQIDEGRQHHRLFPN
jgi:hypothetical protein